MKLEKIQQPSEKRASCAAKLVGTCDDDLQESSRHKLTDNLQDLTRTMSSKSPALL